MSTIPTPGSEIRHVRKTITFTGGVNNGRLGDDVTIFALTGRVIVEGFSAAVASSLVCTDGGVTSLYMAGGGETILVSNGITVDLLTSGKLLDGTTARTDYAALYPAFPVGYAPIIVNAPIKVTVFDEGGGANVTGGSLVFDCWYRPITDDGALAGDDIDEDLKTNIWSKALSDISSVPAITASAKDALNWLFALARNKITQTSSTQTLKKDDGTTTVGTASVSDDGTTFTRNEWS